jgi:hypothetical protein
MTILYVISAGILVWFGFHTIRNNPAMFNKESMGKSFFVIGVLTLGLIAFIALLVFLLKH